MDAQSREDFRSYAAGRSAALLCTAYLRTGNRADAEDLLQAALAKTCVSWDRIRDREAVDGYAAGRSPHADLLVAAAQGRRAPDRRAP